MDPGFEELPAAKLADHLRLFYAEARKKDGDLYSKAALCGLRSSLQRHLQCPPHNRKINIMADVEFKRANNMLIGVLKMQKTQGLDQTIHYQVISQLDTDKLMTCGMLSPETPEGLQNLV